MFQFVLEGLVNQETSILSCRQTTSLPRQGLRENLGAGNFLNPLLTRERAGLPAFWIEPRMIHSTHALGAARPGITILDAEIQSFDD